MPRALRVAIVSTCAVATPPRGYGGTELVVAELANALAQLGHRPTVFATGDSTCAGARATSFARGVWPPDDLAELRHASEAWAAIADGDFDVVHVNHASAVPFTDHFRIPTVATVHHDRLPSYARHYAAFPEVTFVAISKRQAELSPDVPFGAVVHHGLDIDRYPAGRGGNACAFLGRFAPEKGVHHAIDAARAAGLRLELGGEAHPEARAYFEREVEPRLGPDTHLLGPVDHERKVALLGRSSCLLFPIAWEEPFGLVMVESMLVGTPVIAFRHGAAPEVVEHGVTGFLVDDVEEMRMCLADVGAIDRERCRAVARRRFSAQRMARSYVTVYEDAIRRKRGDDDALDAVG